MKIKFLNKNNDLYFNIVDGAVLRDNYNETLDSASIKITHLDHKLDIEPYDVVYLIDINYLPNKYMVVDRYTCRQISFNEPIYYEYDIELVSETKQLENVVLPSLKITQNKNSVTQRSIYSYIVQYMSEYCEQVRYKLPDNTIVFDNKYSISQDVFDKFNNVECPEMQWNNPTLREVLTDLMMVKDCIPVLIDGWLKYIDISKSENVKGSTDTINFIQESQSSDDYVSDLRMDLKNVMQTERKGIDNTTDVVEYITPRSSNYILTTENMEIHTQNPILRIKHLYMGFCSKRKPKITGSESAGLRYYYEQDLMNCRDLGDDNVYHCVYETQEAQSLPLWFKPLDGFINKWKTMASFQNFVLTYSRGGTTITGLSKKNTLMHFLNIDKLAIQYLVKCTQEHEIKYPFDEQLDDGYGVENNLWDIFFKIEYETTADSVVRVGKYLPSNNYREIIDNQTNSYIDPYAQGLLEYVKIERLGNKMSLVNARAFNSQDIFNMGSKINDKIVFKRDIQCFKDYAIINYWTTPNYVLRNYFTGVKSKIRSWKILSGNEALTKHDLIKLYAEFSYKQKNEIELNYTISRFSSLPEMFLSLTNKFVGCFISPIYSGSDNTKWYGMNFTSKVVGRSVLLTWGLNDNYNIGKHITNNVEGGLGQANYVYADKNGNNDGCKINFLAYYNVFEPYGMLAPNNGDKIESAGTTESKGVRAMIKASHDLPLVPYSVITNANTSIEFDYTHHKDNAEITRLTTQIEFCSDDSNIVVYNEFVDRQSIISNLGVLDKINYKHIKLYLSSVEPSLNAQEPIIDGVLIGENVLTLTNINKVTSKLSINLTNDQQFTWIGASISNKNMYFVINNKPILGFKNFTDYNKNIYLNILKTRDTSVRDSDNCYLKVGTIVI